MGLPTVPYWVTHRQLLVPNSNLGTTLKLSLWITLYHHGWTERDHILKSNLLSGGRALADAGTEHSIQMVRHHRPLPRYCGCLVSFNVPMLQVGLRQIGAPGRTGAILTWPAVGRMGGTVVTLGAVSPLVLPTFPSPFLQTP